LTQLRVDLKIKAADANFMMLAGKLKVASPKMPSIHTTFKIWKWGTHLACG